jgi:hypothetical protein
VQLEEVDRLDAEIGETALDERGEVLTAVAGRGLARESAARLRSHDDRLAPFAQELADEALGVSVAVDVSGIDEVDAEIDRLVEGAH